MSVIFGSNIFNLASLLGLSAVLVGRVACGRETLVFNAGVALWITVAVGLQLLFDVSTLVTGLLIAVAMLPYLLVSALKPGHLRWLRLPEPVAAWFREAVSDTEVNTGGQKRPSQPSWADAVAVLPLLGMVVITSVGMVRSATALGERWGVSEVAIGALVLATLTGIPNVVAALRLAAHGRGAAVVSETFDCNSLTLIAGAYLPTVFMASGASSSMARQSLCWLIGSTLLAAIWLLARGSLGRAAGLALIAVYAGFALVVAAR